MTILRRRFIAIAFLCRRCCHGTAHCADYIPTMLAPGLSCGLSAGAEGEKREVVSSQTKKKNGEKDMLTTTLTPPPIKIEEGNASPFKRCFAITAASRQHCESSKSTLANPVLPPQICSWPPDLDFLSIHLGFLVILCNIWVFVMLHAISVSDMMKFIRHKQQ